MRAFGSAFFVSDCCVCIYGACDRRGLLLREGSSSLGILWIRSDATVSDGLANTDPVFFPVDDPDPLDFETTPGVRPIKTFEEMGLKEDLLRGIYAYGSSSRFLAK